MMTPSLEEQLAEFLADCKNVNKALDRIFHQLVLHEQKDESRQSRTEEIVAAVSVRVAKLEDQRDDTGKIRLDELHSQLREKKEASQWASRLLVQSLVAVTIATVSGAIGAVLTSVIRR